MFIIDFKKYSKVIIKKLFTKKNQKKTFQKFDRKLETPMTSYGVKFLNPE